MPRRASVAVGPPRRHSFAHNRASKRADAVNHVKSQSSHALCRQEIAEQRAIEEIDRECPAAHVGAPQAVVVSKDCVTSDILMPPFGLDCEFADCCCVAQTQIEPLRADRRNDMRSFADECNASVCEPSCGSDTKRKATAARLGLNLPEDRIRRALDFVAQFGVIDICKFVGRPRVEHPDEARSIARQRHERERPAGGMKLG